MRNDIRFHYEGFLTLIIFTVFFSVMFFMHFKTAVRPVGILTATNIKAISPVCILFYTVRLPITQVFLNSLHSCGFSPIWSVLCLFMFALLLSLHVKSLFSLVWISTCLLYNSSQVPYIHIVFSYNFACDSWGKIYIGRLVHGVGMYGDFLQCEQLCALYDLSVPWSLSHSKCTYVIFPLYELFLHNRI